MKDDSVAVCKLCDHVLYGMLEWGNSAPAAKHFPSSFIRRRLINEGRLKSDFFCSVHAENKICANKYAHISTLNWIQPDGKCTRAGR